MSIIRPAIRWTAVAALRNVTWAEERIYDSSNTPLADALAQDQTKPFIVVYTDADTRNVNGRFIDADRTISLVFEIGMATGILTQQGDRTFQIPATDEGM